jgi:hypothetical protein
MAPSPATLLSQVRPTTFTINVFAHQKIPNADAFQEPASSSARGSPVKRQRKDSSARLPFLQLPIPSKTCLTSVLAPGTCLVRGVTGTESCRRFFAYYGEKRNLAAFAASKNFVATYASNGYRYTRVEKPIILLTMPYPVIYKFTGADQTMALY